MHTRFSLSLFFSVAALAASHAQTAPTPAPAATAAPAMAKPQEIVRLDKFEVAAAREQGYATTVAAQVGPLGAAALLDMPLSINVLPRELIANLQATVPDDLFKVSPVAQLSTPQARFFAAATLRGFSSGSTRRVDGNPHTNTFGNIDLEDKERVEIITGLSGFLNGAGNVGGTVNYILKRPTPERLARLTLGYNGGANVHAHADLGGPLDATRRFGYRLNLVAQDGDTAVDHQSITRRFAGGAFDWNLTPQLRLQFDGSHTHYHMAGTDPFWSAPTGVPYPDAPDPSLFFSQPFSMSRSEQHHLGARLAWQIRPRLNLRAGLARRQSRIEIITVNNAFVSGSPGRYRSETAHWEFPDVGSFGAHAFLTGEFTTGPLAHRVTAGYYGDTERRTNLISSPGGSTSLTATGLALLTAPVLRDTSPPRPAGAKRLSNRARYDNVVVGDELRLGEKWSALVGANRAAIADRTYNAAGALTTRYEKHKVTPTFAVLFKPAVRLLAYVSAMQSFEKGGTAALTFGGSPVANAGAILPPLTSQQLELGVKYQLRAALLTAAVYEIDKGLQYYDVSTPAAPVYVQSGRQVHRGAEFTATGEVFPGLTVVAGLTSLQARIAENKQTPALVGREPINVAEFTAKLYAEYALPAVRGLVLTAGVFRTGDQAVDNANMIEIPAFTTVDLGFRYTARLAERPTVFRLAVTNAAQERYWLTSAYVGARRTLRASVTRDF